MTKKHKNPGQQCWCGNPQRRSCCEPILNNTKVAQTPEQLMRSRYSAYVTCNSAYLLSSWHNSTRPDTVSIDPDQHWLGLTIKTVSTGTNDTTQGTVEFVARFKIRGKGHRLRERSQFAKFDDRWYYIDGEMIDG